MSEAEDIVAWIVGDTDLAALIGDHIYPVVLPATPSFPAVTYQRIDDVETPTQDGPGLAEPRWRFKVWTQTYIELDAIVVALKAAFNARHDGPFRSSFVDGGPQDRDLKTGRWWEVVDVLGWQPA